MSITPPKLAEKLLEKLLYNDVWKTTLEDSGERVIVISFTLSRFNRNLYTTDEVLPLSFKGKISAL